MLNGDDILAVNPAVATQETDGELVVVLPDEGKYVVLNVTGARVLKHADGRQTLDDIVSAIARSFGTDIEKVRKDVVAFSEDLVSRGILHIVTAGDSNRSP